MCRARQQRAVAERVLGTGAFVDRLLAEATAPPAPLSPARAWRAFERIRRQLTESFAITEAELTRGSRRRPVAAARAAVAAVAVRGLGLPIARVAPALGVTPMPLARGLARGEKLLQEHGWLTPEKAAREALE